MKTPVIAIGLDAADPVLIEHWMAAGRLPNLSRLCAEGAYGRLLNLEYYMAETPWTTFATGCMPARTGYWTPVQLTSGTYDVREVGAYEFDEVPPFYALGPDYRVAAFDLPQAVLSDDVNGPQVLAWGAHSPQVPSHSLPPELFAQIFERYGEHPALNRDHGVWWDSRYLAGLYEQLQTGITRRAAICRDWLESERWDLFLTVFGETHSAGHDFWHLGHADSPLHARSNAGSDWLLDIYEAVDRAVGDVLERAPEDSYRVVFSVHGMGHVTDVASMVLLPEFMYRYSFGEPMLAPGRMSRRVPDVRGPVRNQRWTAEVWEYGYDPNPLRRMLKRITPTKVHRRITRTFGGPIAPGLYSPAEIKALGKDLAWQPAQWYSKSWPRMKAFALPTFSDGYIRINLEGREPNGLVGADEYDAVCEDLVTALHELTNPRTGNPIVKTVVRTRPSAADHDPKGPDPDLIVVWGDEPVDVVDHPRLGRIGPVPFRRAGTHRPRGFWAVQGPGIAAGTRLPGAHAVDLPATLLSLMGAPVPEHLDGRPIISPARSVPDVAAGGG